MNLRLFGATAAFAIVLAGASTAGAVQQKAAQQPVAVTDLPAAVTASVAKTYPGGTIISAAKMSRGAQVRYELSVKATPDAAPMAVLVSPEGVISTNAKSKPAPPGGKGARKAGAAAGTPQPFPIVDLPKAVVNAVKDAYPKDVITSATKVTQGQKVLFQLMLNDVSSVAPMHVTVTEDGQIQKR